MSVIVSATINKDSPSIAGGVIADEIYGDIAQQINRDPNRSDDLRQAQSIAEDFLQASDKTYSLVEAGEHVRHRFRDYRTKTHGGNPYSIDVVMGVLENLYKVQPGARRRLFLAMKHYAEAKDTMAHAEAERQAQIVIENCSEVLWPSEPGETGENHDWLERHGVTYRFLVSRLPGEFEIEFTYGEHTLTFMLNVGDH